MELIRLNNYRGFNRVPSDRIGSIIQRIEQQEKDKFILEDIQELIDVCYLEGFQDGYHFADWLHYKTY